MLTLNLNCSVSSERMQDYGTSWCHSGCGGLGLWLLPCCLAQFPGTMFLQPHVPVDGLPVAILGLGSRWETLLGQVLWFSTSQKHLQKYLIPWHSNQNWVAKINRDFFWASIACSSLTLGVMLILPTVTLPATHPASDADIERCSKLKNSTYRFWCFHNAC